MLALAAITLILVVLVLIVLRKARASAAEEKACSEILERYRWHAAGFESAARGGIYGMAGYGRERDRLWADEAAFVEKYGYRPSERYRID